MLGYLSGSGIFFSLLLLYFNAGKYKSSIYLGIYFIIVYLYGFTQYVIFYSHSVLLNSITVVNLTALLYLAGPLLYWYTRSVLNDNPKFRKRDLLHLVPALVYLIAAIPYLFSPYAQTVEIATSIVVNPGFLRTFNATLLSEILSNTVIYLSRPVQVLVYILWSMILFLRYKKRHIDSLLFPGQHFMTGWLAFFLVYQLLLVLGNIIGLTKSLTIEIEKLSEAAYFMQVFAGAGLTGLLASLFFYPEILYGLPRIPATAVAPDQKEETIEEPALSPKINTSVYEPAYLISIGQLSDSCMSKYQPFLQPKINLAQFSELINIPTHHLAYFFREIRKKAFNDYVNEYRVEHAKSMITEGKTANLTLEAIGVLSGFSSRTTFFRAFKKVEDVSPGAFADKIY